MVSGLCYSCCMKPKWRERQRAYTLRAEGKSLNEIKCKLGVSKSSASLWVRGVKLTAKQLKVLKNRSAEARKMKWEDYRRDHLHPKKCPRWPKRSVEHFFDKWTPEMAYVLGYFAADGCMYKNKNGSAYVAFCSNDLSLIIQIKRILNVTNRIEQRYQTTSDGRKISTKRYTLQVGSRRIYSRLRTLGLTPNKSLTLKFPRVPDRVLMHFVRGYFDGDGCVTLGTYKRKNRPSAVTMFAIRFICGSRPFLSALQKRLRKAVPVQGGSVTSHNGRAYILSYGRRFDTRQLCRFLYPTNAVPHLARKKRIFDKALAVINRTRSSMEERLPVTQKVAGSIPVGSANKSNQ